MKKLSQGLARFVVAGVLLLVALPAMAQIVIARVSIEDQTMMVYVDNALAHVWPVSTGARATRTPRGSFKPYWLDKNHVSSKYGREPMPYAVFFLRGYAVHGTTEPELLGRPVSHGCVRLLTANARTLYALVEKYGMKDSRIVVVP